MDDVSDDVTDRADVTGVQADVTGKARVVDAPRVDLTRKGA